MYHQTKLIIGDFVIDLGKAQKRETNMVKLVLYMAGNAAENKNALVTKRKTEILI